MFRRPSCVMLSPFFHHQDKGGVEKYISNKELVDKSAYISRQIVSTYNRTVQLHQRRAETLQGRCNPAKDEISCRERLPTPKHKPTPPQLYRKGVGEKVYDPFRQNHASIFQREREITADLIGNQFG